MPLKTGKLDEPSINMTPMIDVIFLLLVFFLATSSFQTVERMLPSGVSSLPESGGGDVEPPAEPTEDVIDQVVVKLALAGDTVRATVNDRELSDPSMLQAELLAISSIKADVPVIIAPEPNVRIAVAVRAYDDARLAGLARVYMAVHSGN